MTERLDTIGKNGLQFYSKISASMSHDIKNALAIINENAGLLDDFALMSHQGVPINPERVKTLAAMITKQVGRANEIAKKMNQLAHSLDQPVAVVDLTKTLRLLTALTSRSPQMRNVTMGIIESLHPVKVETAPFFLMTLIWYLLDCATAAEKVASLTIAAEHRKDGARIVFRFKGHTRKLGEILATKQADGFLDFLNAKLTAGHDHQDFFLYLPARLNAFNP